MKIVFTGGVTGGHFYPIVAVIQKCIEFIDKEKIVDAKMYFFAPSPYNKRVLFENGVRYQHIMAGKMKVSPVIRIPMELLKIAVGFAEALFKLWAIYPDVVFGKGGYGSFPTLLAAKFLRIPVIIHESDSIPGKTNLWAGKFADRVAVSYPEAAEYFDKKKTAYTGQPVRKEILVPTTHGAFEYLHLDPNLPVILILGGSQGARRINETILDVLPELLNRYQIIHQVGKANLREIEGTSSVILENNPNKNRYKIFDYLNDLAMRMSAGASTLVISRGGSTIFEIAAWGLPSIIIPLSEEISHDQTKNAFNFARSGGTVVIEERNLSPHLLISEIDKIMKDEGTREKMKKATFSFHKPDAAEKIAQEILSITLAHEE